MKTSLNINKIAIVSGLFLGAFALSALASGVWTTAPQNPPNGNTPAPINVGAVSQSKEGAFAVGKTTAPSTGYKLDVNGFGMFTGLSISGKTVTDKLVVGAVLGATSATDLLASGQMMTDKITIGPFESSRGGQVLTYNGTSGEAEWKPNTSGLSGASRIYCAAAGDGTKYYIPRDSSDAIYQLIKKINTEISSEISGEQLLNDSSPSANNGVGLLKASFLTPGSTSYTNKALANPTQDQQLSNPPRAYCPTNLDGTTKKLLFHSMVGWAKDEQDFNDLQRIVTVVKGDYTANSISCIAKGQDRPTLVVGMGLCI